MNQEHIRVDQCLFGYEDGHRLLSSSIPLGDETSTLTSLSDLAPGAVFGRSSGYWTGVPAPEIGRYALMRTWPAPEMPRPGCVWTHALLLSPDALENVEDLSMLRLLVVRPRNSLERDAYRRPFIIDPNRHDTDVSRTTYSSERVSSVLESLYNQADSAVHIAEPGEIDNAIFAVWSQQWPRLRRNIRFQTAAVRGSRPSSAPRFDVTAVLSSSAEALASERPKIINQEWIDAAIGDARHGGSLRKFLRRYGSDVRRQRGSFRPLVEVRLLENSQEESVGASLLSIITQSFPDLADAQQLKQDLVDGSLIPQAQLEILWFVLAGSGGKVFPSPSPKGVARLALLWPERPNDLLHLAEGAADADDDLGQSIFSCVTSAIPTDVFWEMTEPYPRVRRRMLESRPTLLAERGASSLDNTTFAELLSALPIDYDVATLLLPQLISRDDDRIARIALERHPRAVAVTVVKAADAGSAPVGRAWVRALVQNPAVLLDVEVMKDVGRTSLLYDLADALGWLSPAVVAAGTDPWIAALQSVSSDLPDERRDTFRSFMVALALASGGEGSRRVLEKFFEAVHHEILRARLPWRGRDLLAPFLPDLGWARGWDLGLRLRLAVAATYVRRGYPAESYAKLASGQKVKRMLADAAKEITGGKPYARAANE